MVPVSLLSFQCLTFAGTPIHPPQGQIEEVHWHADMSSQKALEDQVKLRLMQTGENPGRFVSLLPVREQVCNYA